MTYRGAILLAQEATFNPAGNYLTFTGPITLNLPSTPKSAAGGAGNALVSRAGNIRLAGGGSYFRYRRSRRRDSARQNNGVATMLTSISVATRTEIRRTTRCST